MDRKIRKLHGSLQDSSDEEPPFKDFTQVLKGTSKKSGPINKKLSELINTLCQSLWQQKELVDKPKDEIGTSDPPQHCQKLAIKYCNEHGNMVNIAHGNNLLNQTRRKYRTCLTWSHV